MSGNDVAVLGVGMHPWGKWGRNFVEYGVAAAGALRLEAHGSTWVLPPARAALIAAGEPIQVSIPRPVTTSCCPG